MTCLATGLDSTTWFDFESLFTVRTSRFVACCLLLAACCLLLAACCLLLAACCLQSSVKRAETLTRHQQSAAIRLSRHQDWRNVGQDVQRRCWLLNTQSARN